MKHFDTFGVMIDCSRNAVMSVSALKKFISLLAKMGYNEVQLYTEDTYEVDGEPFFGIFRGRYSQSELIELDGYCRSIGVELVPCIQTLAHLNAAFRWGKYAAINDIDDILLVGDERTYALIENMIATCRKCFSTKKIHIGMDEAHNLGRGRYRDVNGEVDGSEILLSHLTRVTAITEKYGFDPMMWSDMFYRLASGGAYYTSDSDFGENVRSKIPPTLSLVYWDYYHTDEQTYTSMLNAHKALTERVIFAGGAWKWAGFTPHNDFSLRCTRAALSAAKKAGIRDIFITMWGDNGAESSSYAVLPTLVTAACIADGITDEDEIKSRFYEWVGVSFDDFMLLDLPDTITKSDGVLTPSKYELYNDPFLGLMDSAVCEGDGAKYADFTLRLSDGAERAGEYRYLFDAAAALTDALSVKAELGPRTRAAYESFKSGNRTALDGIIDDYATAIERVETFVTAFRRQWFLENKPHGFDVQDLRLGGLLMRLSSCRERLILLKNGETDMIPELEEVLPPVYSGTVSCNHWRSTVTANVL